jgi:ectoine hydroxylase-related dioxygenase (phytanoyl-CoA dioxygenase family)
MERHLDSPVVWRLCRDNGLRRRLREHVGEHLVLWRSELWVNRPGSRVLPAWHHDVYPRLLRGIGRSVNAYVALTDIDASNGFEYLPASVRAGHELKISRTDPHTGNHFFQVPEDIERKAAPVVLRPGEFLLFTGGLIHRSLRNTGGRARVALTLRVASPSLRILPGYSPSYGPVAL